MGLALDEPEETDVVEKIKGIRVALDYRISDHAKGITLDFEDSQEGAGLVMRGQSDCC
ncbi:hypothetical protein ACFQPF_11440 [Fictibacillus iocasae]|uniref:Uncharacterized protein n=1 Tax=Fictibacillus iocasae TaxID=2715437 RepID=A0ABW2NP86_9BACL